MCTYTEREKEKEKNYLPVCFVSLLQNLSTIKSDNKNHK